LFRRSFPPISRPAVSQVTTSYAGPRVAMRTPDSLPVLAREWHGHYVAARRLTVKKRLTVSAGLRPDLAWGAHLRRWAGARLVPGLFPHERPFAGEWTGGMAVALAQQRTGLKAESAQVEHAAVAVQMGTVLMFAKNARRAWSSWSSARGFRMAVTVRRSERPAPWRIRRSWLAAPRNRDGICVIASVTAVRGGRVESGPSFR